MTGAFVQTNKDSQRAQSQPIGYVIREDGCWEWTGSRNSAGYGLTFLDGRPSKAHRALWVRTHGPVPEGLELDHLCRNRGCVNPAHLEPVTHRTNILRGKGITAEYAQKTHCPKGHPYSGYNLRVTTPGARKCRVCTNRQRSANRSRPRGGQRGEANGLAKLTSTDVLRIFEWRRAGMTYQAIADRLPVSASQVSRVLRREVWTHCAAPSSTVLAHSEVPDDARP